MGGKVTKRNRGSKPTVNTGGNGGSGANGTIIYVDKVAIQKSTINYSIGGNGSTNLGTKLNRNELFNTTNGQNSDSYDNANGGNGGNGNAGGPTIIYIDDDPNKTYTAPGGNQGLGGGGASNNNSPGGGTPGAPGNTPENRIRKDFNYPTIGGSSVQFIWFYE